MARPKPRRSPRPATASFAAAAAEFAARGYAGANVDRIARAARLNKAMIYYHFKSKAALYREILSDMFQAVARRRAAGRRRPTRAPEDKIRGYVDAIAAAAEARPHFPADLAARDRRRRRAHRRRPRSPTSATCSARSARIIEEGIRAGRFQPHRSAAAAGRHHRAADVLLRDRAPAPQDGARRRRRRRPPSHRDVVVDHIQRVTLAQLEGKL